MKKLTKLFAILFLLLFGMGSYTFGQSNEYLKSSTDKKELPKVWVYPGNSPTVSIKYQQHLNKLIKLKLAEQNWNPLSNDEVLWKSDSMGYSYFPDCITQSCLLRWGKKLSSERVVSTQIYHREKDYLIRIEELNVIGDSLINNFEYIVDPSFNLKELVETWNQQRAGQAFKPQKGLDLYNPKSSVHLYALMAQGIGAGLVLWNSLDFYVNDPVKVSSTYSESRSLRSSNYRGFFARLPESYRIKSMGRSGSAQINDLAATSYNPALTSTLRQNQFQVFKESSGYGPDRIFAAFGGPLGFNLHSAQSVYYYGDELASEWTFRSIWALDLSAFSRLTQNIQLGIGLKGYMAQVGSLCQDLTLSEQINCQQGRTLGFGIDLGLLAEPVENLKWGISFEDPISYLWHHNLNRNEYYTENLNSRWRTSINYNYNDITLTGETQTTYQEWRSMRFSLGVQNQMSWFTINGGGYYQPSALGGIVMTFGFGIELGQDAWIGKLAWAYELPVEDQQIRNDEQTLELQIHF